MDYDAWKYSPPTPHPYVQQVVNSHLDRARQYMPPAGETNPYWVRTWPGANTVNTHVVDKSPYGDDVQGWTACDKDKGTCDVILMRNADRECVEGHENMHAAGWDHPNHRRGFICPTTGLQLPHK